MVLKNAILPHRNIHQYTWTSPDRQTHNQIDHLSIGMRWHLRMLDVRCLRVDVCYTNYSLMVTKVRERLAISKNAAQKFDV
jgi:hypothetical protein